MNSTTIWILVAFIAYMAMMLLIGASYMKTGKSTEDYFLGGRKLGGWVHRHPKRLPQPAEAPKGGANAHRGHRPCYPSGCR